MTDCRDLLGVKESASIAEIKSAFRRLAKKLHPDKGGDAVKFKELKAAYEEAIKHAGSGQAASITYASSWSPRPFSSSSSYDPFTDPNYDSYVFFEPSHPNSADFERHLQAHNCPHCHGRGYISKIIRPEDGFLGLQERLCKCQVIGTKS